MIGKKTLESEPIPAAKVKEVLEEFSDKYELNYEQNLALTHATSLNKLSLEDAEKLIAEIEEFLTEKDIVKISDEEKRAKYIHKQAVRLTDILPKDIDDMRLIFVKERFVPSNDEMNELLEIIEEYERKDEE